MSDKDNAVVLLSGGLDSATTLAIAIDQGFVPHVLSFSYGQRHGAELGSVAALCSHYKITNTKLVDIDLTIFGGSALTDLKIDVPKDRDENMMTNIPQTYVPARNTIFLSFALAYAEVIGAENIFIGVNQLDYSGYPDCRREFINAYETMANLATKRGVEGNKVNIRTPLIDLTKSEIIKMGIRLRVPYHLTHSCYDPVFNKSDGKWYACRHCDSCLLRRKGFEEAGVVDPTQYIGGKII